MFIWDLLFCLFKRIASNKKEENFALSKFTVFCSFPKRTKLYLSFDWDLSLVSELGAMPPTRKESKIWRLALETSKTNSIKWKQESVINFDKLKLLLVGCRTT